MSMGSVEMVEEIVPYLPFRSSAVGFTFLVAF